ncbi:MAG: MBL fold metallo-hydrolase [Dehalococcoidia bacterium]|nr:MBL fold metallo-hydrolase [Dehalococcoidia bacterium]
METIPLKAAEALEITVLVDNTIDALLSGDEEVRRNPWVQVVNPVIEGGLTNATLRAEHGFSALVTVTIEGERHRLLFDAGVSPDGLVENMDRLQIEGKDLEAVVLSHGHFDHTGDSTDCRNGSGRRGCPCWRTAKPIRSGEARRPAASRYPCRRPRGPRWKERGSSSSTAMTRRCCFARGCC